MRSWWGRLLIKRLCRLLWLLPLTSVLLFTLVSLAPIDPVQAYVGARMSMIGPEQQAAIAAAWGLDQPGWVRFFHWAAHLAQGDLGDSITYNAPVLTVLAERFPASLALMGLAFFAAFIVGSGGGVLAAMTRGRWPDRLIRGWAMLISVSPGFWIALLLIAIFAVQLDWLPSCCALPPGVTQGEADWGQYGRHLILPVLTLSIYGTGPLILHVRQRLIAFLDGPSARHLRIHGMPAARLALGPGARHALGSAVTVHLASVGELFGGSVLAETVFAWPGLGQATVKAATGADAPLLLGIALVTVVIVLLGNLLADLLAAWVDPRLRLAPPMTVATSVKRWPRWHRLGAVARLKTVLRLKAEPKS